MKKPQLPKPIKVTATASRLINRNIISVNGRSSIRLEPEIWESLSEICEREKISMADLVQTVDNGRKTGGRTSAIRVFAFNYFRQAATVEGHRLAGHNPPTSTSSKPERSRTLSALHWWHD
jgi:predicted DNA-binding ribbon-helix-helix protein